MATVGSGWFVFWEISLITTNASFLLPATKSKQLEHVTRAMLFVLMMISSAIHHTCCSFPMSGCLLPAALARKLDFFFAQLLIPVTALYLVIFPAQYAYIERWLIMSFAFVLFFVEALYNEPFIIQVIIAGASLSIIVIYWVGWGIPAEYNWKYLSLGMALTGLACTLFSTQKNWHEGYGLVHSMWHVVAALGQYFILCVRDEPLSPLAAFDAVLPDFAKRFPRYFRRHGALV